MESSSSSSWTYTADNKHAAILSVSVCLSGWNITILKNKFPPFSQYMFIAYLDPCLLFSVYGLGILVYRIVMCILFIYRPGSPRALSFYSFEAYQLIKQNMFLSPTTAAAAGTTKAYLIFVPMHKSSTTGMLRVQ